MINISNYRQSAFPANSQQPTANSPLRRGVSLVEVLIAMGVLAVGLLGAAALFPVGGHYMQTGDAADRGDAIAQAALNDAVTRGWLEPKNWRMYGANSPSGQWFGNSLKQLKLNLISVRLSSSATGLTANHQYEFVRRYGSVVLVDPFVIGGAHEEFLGPEGGSVFLNSLRVFPVNNLFTTTHPTGVAVQSPADGLWYPWCYNPPALPTAFSGQPLNPVRVPIIRVTLPASSPEKLVSLADPLVASEDDLVIELPSKADSPAQQSYFVHGTTQTPVKRQAKRDFSYFISIVPTCSEANTAIATNPEAFEYDVSAVVFRKRVFTSVSDLQRDEFSVTGKVVSRGVNGGELLCDRPAGAVDTTDYKHLKPGNWVLVYGPAPTGNPSRPQLFAQWYRILSVEDDPTPAPNTNSNRRQLLSLRGPDWPWSGTEPISQDLRVAILPDIVAVHTKTMRLEAGSEWSAE